MHVELGSIIKYYKNRATNKSINIYNEDLFTEVIERQFKMMIKMSKFMKKRRKCTHVGLMSA